MSTQGTSRHLASPRTLLFLERRGRWLFLEGGPSKWFAGRLNGLGGRVEPDEDAETAARRECLEETGLLPLALDLAATVHAAMEPPEPPVLLLVFLGTLPPGDLRPTDEGRHRWHRLEALADPSIPFLDDVRTLLPHLVGRGDRVLHLGPARHATS